MNKEYIQKKHEEDLERIQNFRLLDDDFMSKVFEDKACAEFLLQIIMQRDDLKVQYVNVQQEVNNLQGRSIVLDICAIDAEEKLYDIEIQRANEGAAAKRARYNSSLLDANITDPGDAYEKLGETYVIFITEKDVLKRGLPIYHIDRIIRETGEEFQDGEHIIYVNARIKDETNLGKLMHDFACKKADEMHYKVLAERVRYFKESKEGVARMCEAIEKMREEAYEDGRTEGREEGIKGIIKMAERFNLSQQEIVEQLCETLNVTKKEAEEWYQKYR